MSSIYLHLDYSSGLRHPEYFPMFALKPLICMHWNIFTDPPRSHAKLKATNSLSLCFRFLFSPNSLSQTPFGPPLFVKPYVAPTSLTQVTDGFFVPRPGGSAGEVFPYWAGKVDVEEVSAVELQRLLQLLHTHVRPGEHARGEVSTADPTQSTAEPARHAPMLPASTASHRGTDQAVMKITAHIWDIYSKGNTAYLVSTILFMWILSIWHRTPFPTLHPDSSFKVNPMALLILCPENDTQAMVRKAFRLCPRLSPSHRMTIIMVWRPTESLFQHMLASRPFKEK